DHDREDREDGREDREDERRRQPTPPPQDVALNPDLLAQLRALQDWAYRAKATSEGEPGENPPAFEAAPLPAPEPPAEETPVAAAAAETPGTASSEMASD